ncbi:AMP-binding protein [Nocardioides sp. dk4132]|uniref:AMP-binding protein n=1 Tax=unclassified Nocardioides TaxID=2615069 RepID=UPI001295919A|nr:MULTISPECIES: AMP-binding protein [unclassified Nocardioides]MQW74485.1 AMP-binding protein [Nocardioides sp. dk4132]QGA06416.1 AMP-binding protein [Nocardioides sp. dk884]
MSFTSASTAATVATLSAWLESHDEPAPWVVETSGSTGRPKRVRLSRRAVLASVEASARRIGASGGWLLALPAAYVAGVQVICRSLVAGHEPVLLEDHPSFAAATAAMPAGDRFVSLVPTQLQRLLTDPESAAALATFHTVLLGGGPIDPALRERARAAGVRVVATYGSAETAGGCVYDGLPLDGVAVAIGDDGRVRISGPTLFEGYEDDPELTASVLVDGWFLTSDAGRFDEDGRLQVLGRLDDVIVTGGVNVPGPAVAARLRAHPGVRAAEVLGVPDEEWGNRVVAFVVVDVALPGLAELRDWVAAEHPRSWAPRQLVALDDVPLLANGKPDRLRLRALATGDTGGEA